MNAAALLLILLLAPASAAAAPMSELKAFPKDMWGSFKEQGRNEGLLTFVAAGGGAAIARFGSRTYFDDYHLADTLLRRRPLGKRATDAGAVIGFPAYLMTGMGATYLAGTYLEADEAQEFGILGFEALALAGVQTAFLKISVNRLRPDKTDRAAFPSGHSSGSFALAAVAASKYGWKVGVPACMAASFVAFSRMENGSHYLSDVVFGAGLGIMSGRAVYNYRKGRHPGRYAFSPFLAPNGGGLTVAF
jgi:hypothetical protein